jgi:hypothetical protein
MMMGNARGCVLGGTNARRAADDDIDLDSDQVGRKLGKPLRAFPRPTVFDGDVLVLSPAEFAETVAECIESGRRGERGHTTDDEGPPAHHSIT